VTRSARTGATSEWEVRLDGEGLAGEVGLGLARFLALLSRWNQATDLVASPDPSTLLGYVREALAGLPWVPAEGRLLDVGSGSGMPAVPLLLARPRMQGVLLEPRERRWAFLREVVRELDLPAEVRRERLASHPGSGYDVMTVRGVAAPAWLAEGPRVLRPSARVLWWTSARNAAQLGDMVAEGHVVECPLPSPAIGTIAIWQRCST